MSFAGVSAAQSPSTTSLTSGPNPANLGQSVTLTATVTSGATGKVTFYDAAIVLGTGTISGNVATLTTVQLQAGARSLHAHYLGDGAYLGSDSSHVAQSVVALPSLGFKPAVLGDFGARSAILLAGDFNGDGKPDLLAFAYQASGAYIALGNGDGSFASPRSIAIGFTNAAAIADFNGDGKLDVVICDSNRLNILTGVGDGTFVAGPNFFVDGFSEAVVVADFNNDGKPDLVVDTSNGIRVALGNGDGTFGAFFPVNSISNIFNQSIAVDDFNQDGKPDIAWAVQGSSAVSIMLGIGDGTFAPPSTYTVPAISGPIVVADFNSDGIPDFAVVTSAAVAVARGNGNGTFQPAQSFSATTSPSLLLAADFNGDGRTDLLSGGSLGPLNVLLGNNDGTFQPPVSWNVYAPFSVAVADFNGDGKTDLVSSQGFNFTLPGFFPITTLSFLFGGAIPDLSASVAHGLGFTQGQNGATCKVSITNAGTLPTSGAIGVASFLPAGFSATAITGDGWTCVLATLACTRSESLAIGTNLPDITITVNIAANLTGSATFTATVSGGNDQNSANNIATDISPIRLNALNVLTSTPNPSSLGQDAMLTLSLGAGVTGTVVFYDGVTTLGSATAVNGQATFVTRLLPAGVRNLKAIYLGDSNYGPGISAIHTQTVTETPVNGLQPIASITTPSPARNLSVIDFNRDGKPDLVAVWADGTVRVSLGNGDGTFQAAQQLAGIFGVAFMEFADFNLDGKLDIVMVAAGGSNFAQVFLGNGDGTFQSLPDILQGQFLTSVKSADFNLDGIPDLVVGTNQVTLILLGKGDGTFKPAITLPVNALFHEIFVADFNRDAIPDLFIAPQGSGDIAQVLLGKGDGTFQTALSVNITQPASYTLGDYNGDGIIDIGSAHWQSQDILLGNGDGTFQPPIVSNVTPMLGGDPGVTGDFNGDGKLDLAYREYSGDHFTILFGDGTGRFISAATYLASAHGGNLVTADFNGDGKPDLAVASPDSFTTSAGRIDIFLGGQFSGPAATSSHFDPFVAGQTGMYQITVSNRTFTSAIVTVRDVLPSGLTLINASGTGWICAPDATCNRADLLNPDSNFPPITVKVRVSAVLTAATLVNTIRLTVNGTDTITTDSTRIAAATTTTLSVLPAAPVQLGQPVTMTAIVSEGNGRVTFKDGGVPIGSAALSGTQASLTTRLLPGGLRELTATYQGDSTHGSSTSSVQLFAIQPAAASGLTPGTTLTAGDGPVAIATGDFNGDGIPDLVTANNVANSVSVFLGTGGGNFAPRVDYAVDSQPSAIAIGDLDGDGKPDLAVANRGSDTLSILRGRGDGTFVLAGTYATGDQPGGVTVADFNGDGGMDLAVYNSGQYSLSVFFGRGDGTFQSGLVSYTGLVGDSLIAGDFDKDGKADLAIGASGNQSVAVLLGIGDGTFSGPTLAQSSYGFGLATGDLDGDGNVDLAFGTPLMLEVHKGDGTGHFPLFQSVSASTYSPKTLLTADLNGDGKLDVVAMTGTGIGTFFGNGDGTVKSPVEYYTGAYNLAATAGDFNGDGRTDLALLSAGTNIVSVQLGIEAPVLQVVSSHIGHFNFNATGIYTLTVSNSGPGATSGTISLSDTLPAGLSAASISGSGWICSAASVSCTRSDLLASSASYPPVTLTVNVGASVNPPVVNLVSVSGINVVPATGLDATIVSNGPPSPVLLSPANGASGVGLQPVLQWAASPGAVSYRVFLGATSQNNVATTASTSYTLAILQSNTTYYWSIGADNQTGDEGVSNTFSFTTVSCSPSLTTSSASWPAAGGSSKVSVLNGPACNWTAASGAPWITITSGATGIGNGDVGYSIAPNTTGQPRTGFLFIAGSTFTTTQAAAGAALRFVPVTPCRIADTRNASGPFGGPAIGANSSRDFPVPASACGIPANAAAYSLNMTVVPLGGLGFLQVWPTGQAQPGVSTLNSSDGRIKANAAIVPAGVNGSITVFASNPTNVIIDINGYFVADPGGTALAFYPIKPCRIADTRGATGSFGGPSLASNISRDFPILGSGCGIPSTSKAYALNMTVVPGAGLGFLSTWPAGQAQPGVSTLNDPTGTIVANGAIVPSGVNGAISVYATNATHLIIDINGYFAPPGGPGALSFYPLNPCRIIDTRSANGIFGGPIVAAATTRDIPIASSECGAPATAKAYSLNATVVPPAGLGFLQLWNTGGGQPAVSTLNDSDATIVANAAIIPAGTGGSVTAYASSTTHLILDINGYFAP